MSYPIELIFSEKPIPYFLQCRQCGQIPFEFQFCQGCSNTFCRNWVTQGTCPDPQCGSQQIMPDSGAITRFLTDLQAKCQYQGCSFICPFNDMSLHLQNCAYKLIQWDCGFQGTVEQVEQHRNNDCLITWRNYCRQLELAIQQKKEEISMMNKCQNCGNENDVKVICKVCLQPPAQVCSIPVAVSQPLPDSIASSNTNLREPAQPNYPVPLISSQERDKLNMSAYSQAQPSAEVSKPISNAPVKENISQLAISQLNSSQIRRAERLPLVECFSCDYLNDLNQIMCIQWDALLITRCQECVNNASYMIRKQFACEECLNLNRIQV